MNARPVRLYRTAQFVADVGGYMSDHEQEAFYQHLARNPLLGEPMEEVPGCLAVEWGNGRVYIRYTVSDDRDAIVLISISEKRRLELDRAGRKQASDLMDTLKKAGIGAAIRELIDRLGDWF